MRECEVRFRPEAMADLEDIYSYILSASQSPNIARGYMLRLRDRCLRIGHVPLGGRLRSDIHEGLRVIPFERTAVIAYLVEGDLVRIVNVFYGGRDYEALLRGWAVPEGYKFDRDEANE